MTKDKSKRFSRSTMTKHSTPILERELYPKTHTGKNGSVYLLCPFCEIPHEIRADMTSPCGTLLRVTAVQTIYKSKAFSEIGMICAKCGKSGGDMTKLNDGFIHVADCTPGVKVLNSNPPFSRLAKFAHGLRDGRVKKWFVKNFGIPREVKELLPTGEQTGKILGYVFYRSE